MIQTIYGILGMTLAMLFVINQHRSTLQEYEDMAQTEHEIMADGVALEVYGYIAGHPFDEATSDDDFVLEEDFKESDLAQSGAEYGKTYEEAEYLEHFNGVETTVQFQAGASTVAFEVSISVHYVDDTNMEVSVQTDKKEVRVTVSHANYTRPLVQHRRILTPTAEFN